MLDLNWKLLEAYLELTSGLVVDEEIAYEINEAGR